MLGGGGSADMNGSVQRPPKQLVPFSSEECLQIQGKLDAKLDPEDISFRPSAQGNVAYLEGWKAFNLANEVFGFNGWSSEIHSFTTDFIDEDAGRISVGMSCMVRIYLRDGTYHEDIGYGSSENQRSKASAFEKAKKEAVTDAMKRALRIFGNKLGNCAYDKVFLRQLKSGGGGDGSRVNPPPSNHPTLPTNANRPQPQVNNNSSNNNNNQYNPNLRPPPEHAPPRQYPNSNPHPNPPLGAYQAAAHPPPDFVPKWQSPKVLLAQDHDAKRVQLNSSSHHHQQQQQQQQPKTPLANHGEVNPSISHAVNAKTPNPPSPSVSSTTLTLTEEQFEAKNSD